MKMRFKTLVLCCALAVCSYSINTASAKVCFIVGGCGGDTDRDNTKDNQDCKSLGFESTVKCENRKPSHTSLIKAVPYLVADTCKSAGTTYYKCKCDVSYYNLTADPNNGGYYSSSQVKADYNVAVCEDDGTKTKHYRGECPSSYKYKLSYGTYGDEQGRDLSLCPHGTNTPSTGEYHGWTYNNADKHECVMVSGQNIGGRRFNYCGCETSYYIEEYAVGGYAPKDKCTDTNGANFYKRLECPTQYKAQGNCTPTDGYVFTAVNLKPSIAPNNITYPSCGNCDCRGYAKDECRGMLVSNPEKAHFCKRNNYDGCSNYWIMIEKEGVCPINMSNTEKYVSPLKNLYANAVEVFKAVFGVNDAMALGGTGSQSYNEGCQYNSSGKCVYPSTGMSCANCPTKVTTGGNNSPTELEYADGFGPGQSWCKSGNCAGISLEFAEATTWGEIVTGKTCAQMDYYTAETCATKASETECAVNKTCFVTCEATEVDKDNQQCYALSTTNCDEGYRTQLTFDNGEHFNYGRANMYAGRYVLSNVTMPWSTSYMPYFANTTYIATDSTGRCYKMETCPEGYHITKGDESVFTYDVAGDGHCFKAKSCNQDTGWAPTRACTGKIVFAINMSTGEKTPQCQNGEWAPADATETEDGITCYAYCQGSTTHTIPDESIFTSSQTSTKPLCYQAWGCVAPWTSYTNSEGGEVATSGDVTCHKGGCTVVEEENKLYCEECNKTCGLYGYSSTISDCYYEGRSVYVGRSVCRLVKVNGLTCYKKSPKTCADAAMLDYYGYYSPNDIVAPNSGYYASGSNSSYIQYFDTVNECEQGLGNNQKCVEHRLWGDAYYGTNDAKSCYYRTEITCEDFSTSTRQYYNTVNDCESAATTGYKCMTETVQGKSCYFKKAKTCSDYKEGGLTLMANYLNGANAECTGTYQKYLGDNLATCYRCYIDNSNSGDSGGGSAGYYSGSNGACYGGQVTISSSGEFSTVTISSEPCGTFYYNYNCSMGESGHVGISVTCSGTSQCNFMINGNRYSSYGTLDLPCGSYMLTKAPY